MKSQLMLIAALVLGGCGGQVDDSTDDSSEALGPAQPYLALGDSIAFGYNPDDAVNHPTDITRFVGYPERVAADEGVADVNAACQGETSGSFLNVTARDNGCHAGWRNLGYAMHVKYASKSQSQLAYALAWLKAHPRTKLITITLGANDLLLAQADCKNDNGCTLWKTPGVVGGVASNLTQILYSLRRAGYFGQIVAVNYYALSYTDPAQLIAVPALNTAIGDTANLFGGQVADVFGAFAKASSATGGDPCKAGLLYVQADGTCDKHPSAKGRALIAHTVESVSLPLW